VSNTAGDTTSSPSSSTADSFRRHFNEEIAYPDGLHLQILAPVEFKPSSTSLASFPHYVKLTVKVVNKGNTAIDLHTFKASVQSDSTDGTQVFDRAGRTSSPPATPILPAGEAVWVLAFGVSNPRNIVMAVTPTSERNTVIYTS
jgi:hypothetical protein